MDVKLIGDKTTMALDPRAVSILQAIFNPPSNQTAEPPVEEGLSKTASVKFMITIQDEKDLLDLGYSQAQIEKIKPQEASDILQAGTKAVQD